ncbi:tetraacyldisaccharide 4'-kinase [Gammaproteobacteria bacterium]|nr:tetraacyldisaccharide 4'-kinase [Gammaproteobacteria bacterium]
MNLLVNAWYKKSVWLVLLKPLSFIFRIVSEYRRRQFSKGRKKQYQADIPVIVVGNISVGGTGKTPLVIYLVEQLKKAGYSPGVVSRGYRSKAKSYPFKVLPDSSPLESGDEALLIAQNTQCPVIIDADRVAAVKILEQDYDCDVILSDDGLQHYRMARDIEIAVVDGTRGFGNGLLFPAGPLREKPSRLTEVDYVICNSKSNAEVPVNSVPMELISQSLCHIKSGEHFPVDEKAGNRQKVHAVAGIGNPERFFTSLCECGFDIITHVFKDHHQYSKADISFDDELDVVMTEKDALKCKGFAGEKDWYLKVEAVLRASFMQNLLTQLKTVKR